MFLSLELLSIPLYVLAGFGRLRIESEEAGLKYFLLGAFSSAFLVYGIALVYGATQATSFAGIGVALDAGRAGSPLLLAVEKPERMTTDVADYGGLGRTHPAGRSHDTLYPVADGAAAINRFCGEVLRVPGSAGGGLYMAGAAGCGHSSGLCLLLLARDRGYVYEGRPGRGGSAARVKFHRLVYRCRNTRLWHSAGPLDAFRRECGERNFLTGCRFGGV